MLGPIFWIIIILIIVSALYVMFGATTSVPIEKFSEIMNNPLSYSQFPFNPQSSLVQQLGWSTPIPGSMRHTDNMSYDLRGDIPISPNPITNNLIWNLPDGVDPIDNSIYLH